MQTFNNLELLQYLQHYGIQSPLLDFTTDRLIALYFAGSEVNYQRPRATNEHVTESLDGSTYNLLEKTNTRQRLSDEEHQQLRNAIDHFYISVVEIDLKLFNQKIEDISVNKNIYDETWIEKNTFNTTITDERRIDYTLFTILYPEKIGKFQNIDKQKGVFIYLDSAGDLDDICAAIFTKNKNPITYHCIPKPSLNYPDKEIVGIESLYRFLVRNEITGKILFDNLLGFKFDLNYLSGE